MGSHHCPLVWEIYNKCGERVSPALEWTDNSHICLINEVQAFLLYNQRMQIIQWKSAQKIPKTRSSWYHHELTALIYLLELEQPWNFLCQGTKVPRNIVEFSDSTRLALKYWTIPDISWNSELQWGQWNSDSSCVGNCKCWWAYQGSWTCCGRDNIHKRIHWTRSRSPTKKPIDAWKSFPWSIVHFLFTKVSALVMHTLARASSLAELCEKIKHQ